MTFCCSNSFFGCTAHTQCTYGVHVACSMVSLYAKMVETIEILLWRSTHPHDWPKEPCIRLGLDPPIEVTLLTEAICQPTVHIYIR